MNFNDYCTRMNLRETRGWTNKMIFDLLKDVEYKSRGNIYGGGEIKLYKIKDIEEIEKTKEYRELRNKVNERRRKIAETQRKKAERQQELDRIEADETIKMVDTFSTTVKRISLEELRENTLKAKEEWNKIHPRYKLEYNEYDFEDDYDYYSFLGYPCDSYGYYEKVYYETDVYNAPKEVIDRWIVNYIRHKLTDYEEEIKKLEFRCGSKEAIKKYRMLLAEEMKKVYPELQNVIDKNMLNIE